ncbi:hypothetical protein [Neokomagataea thailandica]|uniref:Uncharacterized protein n=1 Tax=Neokomagataea tanensis NBRC 106556 TaxID=1223519 RepID=A0ABQ0QJR0_9PROT|nr:MULTISPECIES: hypothetical protein [Neokomagataea]GBR47249.1 hypothetical protein AA106556_1386 [Neokomagataea tanensis NBRC 106556]
MKRGAVFPDLRWWHGLFLGVGVMYCPGVVLVLCVLLLPVAVLMMIDTRADRQRLVIMLFYIGAVMVRPLHHVWGGRAAWPVCVQIVEDEKLLILDWCALAFAWFVAEASTVVARFIGGQRLRVERVRLEKRVTALEEEWGLSSVR